MATITRSTPSRSMMSIMNPAMQFVITRGWGSVSDQVMVLHWTGRPRFLQDAEGSDYTTVAGQITRDHDAFTGATPGRLVRLS